MQRAATCLSVCTARVLLGHNKREQAVPGTVLQLLLFDAFLESLGERALRLAVSRCGLVELGETRDRTARDRRIHQEVCKGRVGTLVDGGSCCKGSSKKDDRSRSWSGDGSRTGV